ncbi:MAG: glycerol-3-phosphate 1-O-acyltransferase PlsY [Deltaproteobacteria bacterium]
MDATTVRGASLVLFAYFLGSVPFGVLVAHLFDRTVDLRKVGSGNIGATNVSRAVGKAGGILTLALDAGKGVLAMLLVTRFLDSRLDLWITLAGGAAFLGHIFPVYLGFRGGKGVATALGIVAFLSPAAALLLAVLFAVIVYLTRYVSLGSLCAAVALPPVMALLASSRHAVLLSLGICFLVIFTHRENIRRLLAGEERKFGSSA